MNGTHVTHTRFTSVGNMQFPALGLLTAASVAAMARPQGLACGDLGIGSDTPRRDHLAADGSGDSGDGDTAGLGQVFGAGVAPIQGKFLGVMNGVLRSPHDRIVGLGMSIRPVGVAPNRSLGGNVGSHEPPFQATELKDEPLKSEYSEVYAMIDTLATRRLLPATTPVITANRKHQLAAHFYYMWDRWYVDLTVGDCIVLLRDGGSIHGYLQCRTDLSTTSLNVTHRLLDRCARHVIKHHGALNRVGDLPEVIHPAAKPKRRAYTSHGLVHITDWLRSRLRRESRRVAYILVALDPGAGMTAEEIYRCIYGDFTDFGTMLAVHARSGRGLASRTIPLTTPYSDVMRQVLRGVNAGYKDEPLMKPDSTRHRNDATDLHLISDSIHKTSQNPSSTGLAPNINRLRYIWIAYHAAACVDFNQLVCATGTIQPFHDTFHRMIVETGALTEAKYWVWTTGNRNEPAYPPLQLVTPTGKES